MSLPFSLYFSYSQGTDTKRIRDQSYTSMYSQEGLQEKESIKFSTDSSNDDHHACRLRQLR